LTQVNLRLSAFVITDKLEQMPDLVDRLYRKLG